MYFYRLKLIIQDKQNCVILICTFLVFLLVMNSLSFGAAKRSSIPVGILNLDDSISANQLVEDLKEVPSLFIYEEERHILNNLLYEEQISTIFVIEEGYEKSIQSGKTKELITMYYLKDNENAKIISDIFAGEMLYNICLNKGYRLYKKLPIEGIDSSSIFTKQEYFKYAQGLMDSADFDFTFDISMITHDGKITEKQTLSNSIIYQQILWGILGMLLSFLAMILAASIVLEHETGVYKRVGISLLHPAMIDISHLAVMLTITSVFSLPMCMLIGNKISAFTFTKGIGLYLLIVLYSTVIGLWFILLAKIIGKVVKYQYLGVLSIAIFGVLGFINLITGFLKSNLLNISKIVPNSWFIQGFTDIILNDTLQEIPYTSYSVLMVMAILMLLLNKIYGDRQSR